jgi:HEAT repeats
MRQAQPAQPQAPATQAPASPPPAQTPPAPKPIVVQGPPQNQPLAQPSLKVEFAGNKLTVSADRMPLSQVLREVGQRTGLDIRDVQDASGLVSVQFSGASVAQGVQELLGGINYAVIGSLASAQEIRQARVVVLSATSTDNLDVGSPLGAPHRSPLQPAGASVHSPATQAGRNIWRAELMSSDPAQQDRGLSEINKLDPKEAFDALQDVLTNGEGVARLRALQFMDQDGSLDENQVVGALREALNDQDSSLRDYSIQALGRQNSPEALDALRQQFESGDAAMRLSVLEAVSQRSDAKSLIQQASNDPDQGVRSMANELLQSGSPQQPQPEIQPSAPAQAPQPPETEPEGTQPDSGDDQSDPQHH